MDKRTYVSQMLYEELERKGIGEGELKRWTRANGFDVKRQYQTIWGAVTGRINVLYMPVVGSAVPQGLRRYGNS